MRSCKAGRVAKDKVRLECCRDTFAGNSIFKFMNRNLQSILNLLAQTKRQIEVHSMDLSYDAMWRIARELKRKDRTMTLVVGDNLSNLQVEQLICASGDHFDIKFAPTVPNYTSHEEV